MSLTDRLQERIDYHKKMADLFNKRGCDIASKYARLNKNLQSYYSQCLTNVILK